MLSDNEEDSGSEVEGEEDEAGWTTTGGSGSTGGELGDDESSEYFDSEPEPRDLR